MMAMFFTQSLTALIGPAAWWPGYGDQQRDERNEEQDERPSQTSTR